MRARYHTRGTCWAERISDAPSTSLSAQSTEPEMPRGQIIALLEIRAGGPDSLFAKVLAILMAVGSDPATNDDRLALCLDGLIRRTPSDEEWELLPRGRHKAEEIAWRYAELYDVHHVTFNFKQARTNMGSFASCACGHWRQTVGRKRGDDDRLRRYAADHLAAAANGTFKKPRPIADFLNEIYPPRLPFSGTTGPEENPGAVRTDVLRPVPGMNSH